MTVGSSSYMTSLFLVPSRAARALVPDAFFKVAEIFPGKSVLFVGAGEFRQTTIGPYEELYIGFYTENRERGPHSNLLRNVYELATNQSRMFMWRNWLSSKVALRRMDRAGSEIFRLGTLDRIDGESSVTLSMEHPSEGRVRLTVPRKSRYPGSDQSMERTHYGRLHGRPCRAQLKLHVESMCTSPREGELLLEGEVAGQLRDLRIPAKPLASVWIEEMKFTLHKPVSLETGAEAPSAVACAAVMPTAEELNAAHSQQSS